MNRPSNPVIEPICLAEAIVFGFVKALFVYEAIYRSGHEMPRAYAPLADRIAAARELHSIAPFLPSEPWGYGLPVRAYIAAEFPKLCAWLLKHEHDLAKVLSVAPQLLRLVSKGRHGEKFSGVDRKTLNDTRIYARQVSTANRAARTQQLSTQRGAWNVCK